MNTTENEMSAADASVASQAADSSGGEAESGSSQIHAPSDGMQVFQRWFEADGVSLSISTVMAAVDGASGYASSDNAFPWSSETMDMCDALLLDAQDPLLRCIDAWLGKELDWQQISYPNGEPERVLTLNSLVGPDRQVSLVMSRDELDALPPFPADWQPFVSATHNVLLAQVLLDRVQVSTRELEKIEPGALVLLPASFESVWRVSLLVEAESDMAQEFVTHCQASLQMPDSAIAIAPLKHPGEKPLEAENAEYIVVVAEELLSINMLRARNAWQRDMVDEYAFSSSQTKLRVQVRPGTGTSADGQVDSSRVLSGILVGMGRGYGVLIDGAN